MSTERCGYTLVDVEGEQYPCDRPAPSWRWYQDVEHEDSLDEACGLHENEGGRRMAQQAEQIADVLALHVSGSVMLSSSMWVDACRHCGYEWPCDTARALGVES